MNKVAVIGSNSFAGSHLISMLLEKSDSKILGINRSPEKNPIFLPYKNQDTSRFKFFQLDLNKDIKNILDLFDKEKPEIIINFAAQSEVGPSWENPEQWFQTNGIGIVNLTNKLNEREYLERYIHISSPEIYGACEGVVTEEAPYNPSTPYAASKAAGDMFIQTLIKNFDFPAILIRSTNYYGPGQQLFKIIPRSIIYIKRGKKISLHGGGRAVKSYIHIRDVCDGIYGAIEKGTIGEIYHLSPQSGYSIRGIVEMIADKLGMDFDEVTEFVGERLGQDARYVIDSSKIKKELGWEPKIPISVGLDEVIKWIEENWEAISKEPLEYIHKE